MRRLGESIEAQSHDNVTMLFSDLVGFTAICSTATPMEIISLLQSLYTQFDVLCGDLDIYKVIDACVWKGIFVFKVLFVVRLMMRFRSSVTQVETIGDAYCAAGGLHRVSSTHAQQIAWMALCMLEVCRFHQTHDGQPIQVSFACQFL
jgi:guanylate cyclase soluble subunit alpha